MNVEGKKMKQKHDDGPRIKIHTNFVEINGERVEVKGLDVKIREGEKTEVTLQLLPCDLDIAALIPGAKVWLEDWECLRRQTNVAAAEEYLLRWGIHLHLTAPIDDTRQYWRVSATYYRDGDRHGALTRWHTDAQMTTADLVKVFTILKDGKFVTLDSRAVWFPSTGAAYFIRDDILFEQERDMLKLEKIVELPSFRYGCKGQPSSTSGKLENYD